MDICTYPDCVKPVDHKGLHEFPWGDSIPWPPEADSDEHPVEQVYRRAEGSGNPYANIRDED